MSYKNFLKSLVIILLIALTRQGFCLSTENYSFKNYIPVSDTANTDTGQIATIITPGNKNGIFDNTADYKYTVKSTYNISQACKITYLVTTEDGKKIKEDSIKIIINKKSTADYHFAMPPLSDGFYKVSFMINASDYDDTTRKVFGIKPEQIVSFHPKPADFDEFWAKTKAELAAVAPNFIMTEKTDLENKDHRVYRIQMQSLENVTINGWLTMPKHKGKFPVYLLLPGYEVAMKPRFGDDDLAVITLDIRGNGDSKDYIKTANKEYVLYNIDDKYKYIYRGAIMDCVRVVDFICSRPEMDKDRILVSGGSQGGYLSLALASLDHRIKLCSVQNPTFCDYRSLLSKVQWPANVMTAYAKTYDKGDMEKLYQTLDYFDAKNFAPNVACPALFGIGLLDYIAPPGNVYSVYNLVPTKKKIFIYPNLTHEVGSTYQPYEYKWLKDEFALFD